MSEVCGSTGIANLRCKLILGHKGPHYAPTTKAQFWWKMKELAEAPPFEEAPVP